MTSRRVTLADMPKFKPDLQQVNKMYIPLQMNNHIINYTWSSKVCQPWRWHEILQCKHGQFKYLKQHVNQNHCKSNVFYGLEDDRCGHSRPGSKKKRVENFHKSQSNGRSVDYLFWWFLSQHSTCHIVPNV